MKKTLLASAVALGLGTAGSASALTMNMTAMNFFGTYGASGTLNSTGGGTFTSSTVFFGTHWTADGVAFFSGSGAHNWAGTGGGLGAFSYNFSLGANQVAWGTHFDWNCSNDIAVLNIMTCAGGLTTGQACIGTGTPMQNGPFVGSAPAFNGVVASASTTAIPVPAAAWLMGSGLIGLAGVARRRKKA